MKKINFLDLFPLPKYLTFPAVGIDICEDSIKFIELFKNGKEIVLGRYGRKSIPVGSFMGGSDGLIIKALLDISKDTGITSAHFSLPEEQAYFLKLRLPKMKCNEIRESIELQLEDHIPYSVSEIVFDYEIVTILENGEFDVNVSVLPFPIVNRYLKILETAKVKPMSFEIEAESTARSIVPKDFEKAMMIVEIRSESSVLSIVSKGVVWFSYTMKIGGDFFTKIISESLSISTEEAGRLKFTSGLSRSPENQEMLFALAPAISSLRDEIIKHYWYWGEHKSSNSGAMEIEKIVLCGSQAIINGLTEYLSASLGLPVSLGNPWVNIADFDKTIPEIPLGMSLEYATAIGLALKSFEIEEGKKQ